MSVRTFALALGLCATALASPVLAHPSPRHGAPPAQCKQEDRPWQRSYDNIVDAFATFDAATSPPAAGAPADVVLADWLAYLDDHVAFEAGNAPTLIGRLAVASYFAPLLPAIGSTRHELRTISPLCGVDNAWVVRGVLHLTRAVDGQPIPDIRFTDTLFLDRHGDDVLRYEIRFDPSPIGLLFAP